MIRFCINCKYFKEKCCVLFGSQNTGAICGFHDYAPGVLNAEHEFNLTMEGSEMESYVLILESLISELTGVLLGDVKNADRINKLCASAKQFVTKEQGQYFSRVSGTCTRAFRYSERFGVGFSPKASRTINAHINYLASKYMEIVINM